MKLEQAHSLSREDAKRRIEKLADYWRTKYGVSVAWTGDSVKITGKLKGIAIDAKVQVNERTIVAEGSDPGLLMRAAATAYLKGKLADYLDPRKSEADLAKLA